MATFQLEIFTSDRLHLMVGVEARLELQVGDQLGVLVVADVEDAVHVVEAGPLLVVVQRLGSHVATVKLEQDPVGEATVLYEQSITNDQ